MKKDRFIADDVLDLIVEWCFVNAPCVIDIPGFMQGLFVIADDAIRDAVLKEREQTLRHVRERSLN